MRSDGQIWGVDQLEQITKVSAGSFEILEIDEPLEEGAQLRLLISIDCRNYPRADGGIPLKARERLWIGIPSRFPLTVPNAHFTHKRYANFAHVQWGNSICLYQAPEVEWVPARGMYGFIERVNEWLRAGAADELDPIGMPLHPPVAYVTSNYSVVPCVDTPLPKPPFWGGFVEVTRDGEVAAELGRWFSYGEKCPEGRLASAILLPGRIPYEYPTTMLELIKSLVARDVPLHLVHDIVNLGALSTPAGKPALFILGAAMRGISGSEPRQHLASWTIDAEQSQKLRDAVLATTPDDPKDIEAFYAWATEAKVEWCRVLDDRPEIVVRRDAEAPSSFWKGKEIALLGCGAIGSAVAPILVRAGVARIELYDNKIVTPGILVRQDFRRSQIGYSKSGALKARLFSIYPDLDVIMHHRDILRLLENTQERARLTSVDVIIDATASRSVSTALELHFRNVAKVHPPIVSMAIGHNADFGMMTLVKQEHVGMSADADRRTKLALSNSVIGKSYLEEFWPTDATRRKPFQPEPGCSSPTFIGSFADVLNLTSRMTNIAASWLANDASAPRCFAMDLSGGGLAAGPNRELGLQLPHYKVVMDKQHGYQIRMSEEALATLLAWTRRSERIAGQKTETGGILFGEFDELLKVIWVDEASGPPPDSIASADGFVCGTVDVREMNAEKSTRTRGSVSFVGMWHTHPQSLPLPSATDHGAMKELLRPGSDFGGRHFLMLILGGTSKAPLLTATVFKRSDYDE